MPDLYCTPDDAIAYFDYNDLVQASNLTDPNATEIDRLRLEQACSVATGTINTYLMRRFKVPLQGASEPLLVALRTHALVLTMEALGGITEEFRLRAESSRRELELLTNPSSEVGLNGEPTQESQPLQTVVFGFEDPNCGCRYSDNLFCPY